MEELNIIDNQFSDQKYFQKRKLPNSVAVLVLGIISIVICQVGFITGTIALVLASKDKKLLNENPNSYSEGSIKNLNAGRICAIIGVSISTLVVIFYVVYFIFIFKLISSNTNDFRDNIFNELNQLDNILLMF